MPSHTALVIACFILVQILTATGGMSQPPEGTSCPPLYLCDPGSFPEPDSWNPGRAESGARGLYVCGRLFRCLLYQCHDEDVLPRMTIRQCWSVYRRSCHRGSCGGCVRHPDWNSGAASAGRLPGYCHPGLRRDHQKPDQCSVCWDRQRRGIHVLHERCLAP